MKILVFGDSHSNYFNINNDLTNVDKKFESIDVNVIKIPGASIRGFGKRNSTLNSRNVFFDELNKYNPDYVVFALGQVDIELGLYYKKIIKSENININHYIREITESYLQTIDEIVKKTSLNKENIIVKGINLSVLSRNRQKAVSYTSRIITENIDSREEIKLYNNKLKEEFPSSLERYGYHLKFNNKLKESLKGNYKYFDINDEIEDKNIKGHVDIRFVPSGFDHHISDTLFIRLLHIEKLMDSILDI